MRGDAGGAGGDGELRRPHRIGMAAAARVAHGRHVIDVHPEPDWPHAHALILPGKARYPLKRSAEETTGVARDCETISFKCFKSSTLRSIVTSVKSSERRSMRTLSMLPPCSPMICAIWASVPG